MRLITELKNMMLYSNTRKFMAPITKNKRKGAAILLLTNSIEKTEELMQLPYMYNPNYYRSFHIDRNVMAYVNGAGIHEEQDDDKFDEVEAKTVSEAILHDYNPDAARITFVNAIGSDAYIVSQTINIGTIKQYFIFFKLGVPREEIKVYIHDSMKSLEAAIPQRLSKNTGLKVYSYNDGNTIHVLSNRVYSEKRLGLRDGKYQNYLRAECIYYALSKTKTKLNENIKSGICTVLSGQLDDIDDDKKELSDYSTARSIKNMIDSSGYIPLFKMIRTSDPSILSEYATRKSILRIMGHNETTLTADHENYQYSNINEISKPKELDELLKLNASLNKLTYIDNDFSSYVIRSPKQMKTDGGGVCWDFVVYQLHLLKHYGKVKSYYIAFNVAPNYPTHTFQIIPYGNGFIHFESAYSRIAGLWYAESEADLILHVVDTMKTQDKQLANTRYEVRSYTPDTGVVGMSALEFMDYMDSQTKVSIRSDKKYNVQKINKSSQILSERAKKGTSDKDYKDMLHVYKQLTEEESVWIGDHFIQSSEAVYTDIKYNGKEPIAFIQAYNHYYNKSEISLVIAVAPKYRGSGLSKMLMKNLISWFYTQRNLKCIEYWVYKKNIKSIGLAESFGFKKIKEEDDDYGEPCILFEFYNEDKSKAINESIIKSKDDIELRLDEWKPREKNILYITGISGSGKTTTARQMANKYNAIYIELDKIRNYKNFQNDSAEDDCEKILKHYFKNETRDTNKMTWYEFNEFFMDAYEYLLNYASSHHDTLFIIEGIQVIDKLHDRPEVLTSPLIIKGTSVIRSMLNRKNRDGEYIIGGKRRNILYMLNWYTDSEKWTKRFRKDVTNEATAIDDQYDEQFEEIQYIANSLKKSELHLITFDNEYKNSKFVIYRNIVYVEQKAIGFIDVYRFPSNPQVAQVVIATNPEYRGYGAAAKLVSEMLEYKFQDEFGVDTLVWNVIPSNVASVKLAEKFGFSRINDELDKYGRLQYKLKVGSLNEEALLEVDANYDKRLKRYLYKERIRTNSQVVKMYADSKARTGIKYTYMKLKQYNGLNLFVDLSYYHSLFLKNQPYKMDKAVNMYFDFIARLINNPNLSEYTDQTVFIPIDLDAWDIQPGTDMTNYKYNLNPVSTIFRLIRTNPDLLKQELGNKTILFVGKRGYFKIDFSHFDLKNISRFKTNIRKLQSNTEPIIDDYDIDALDSGSATERDTGNVIVAKVLDHIEQKMGIELNDVQGDPDISNALSTTRDDSIPVSVDHMRFSKLQEIPTKTMDGSSSYGTSIIFMVPDTNSLGRTLEIPIMNKDEIKTLFSK